MKRRHCRYGGSMNLAAHRFCYSLNALFARAHNLALKTCIFFKWASYARFYNLAFKAAQEGAANKMKA